MKYGILTFHRALNFGAVLQTYALQKAICKLSKQSEILDYRCSDIENNYKPFSISKIFHIRSFLLGFLNNKISISNAKKFRNFTKKFIICSNKAYNKKDDLHNIQNLYTKLIVGSDQVWNYVCTNFDTAFFLDFVSDNKKRNSYAASFGFNQVPRAYRDKYKNLLSGFDKISVREKQGADIIKDLLGLNVPVVLDPTLLLSQEEWEMVSTMPSKKGYILIFVIVESDSIFEFAEKLSKQTGWEILYINDRIFKRNKVTNICSIGPNEWIGYFLNARYIVTNSFHGTAFSINFGKNFFVELLPHPAIANSRLENILDTFNLRSRQIIDCNNENILNDIDYTDTKEKLKIEREKSMAFLKSIVSDL